MICFYFIRVTERWSACVCILAFSAFDAVGWAARRASGLKKMSCVVQAWLSVCSDVQTCIWPSWCHFHSLSLASVKSRLALPFLLPYPGSPGKMAVIWVYLWLKTDAYEMYCKIHTAVQERATKCGVNVIHNKLLNGPVCYTQGHGYISRIDDGKYDT